LEERFKSLSANMAKNFYARDRIEGIRALSEVLAP
jgi:hypothetical protein